MTKTVVVKQENDVLKETLIRLNKLYGAGTVISGDQKSLDIPSVSTGSLLLDEATGVQGLPYGRIVEVYGPESSGKTTLCIHVLANGQKDKEDTRKVALIDMEHSIEPSYMAALDVNLEDLILSQPPYGESALEVAHQLIKTGKVKIVIIDSVATLVPKAEMEGEIGDSSVARMGRMMSQALRTLSPVVEQNNCLLIFTNQLRERVGIMFGNPETTTGGNSLRFYASMRIDMRKTPDKVNELNKTRIKIIKSKVSKPFKEVEVEILWGKGFNRLGEVLELATEKEIIKKSGGSHTWKDNRIGKSHDETVQFLQDNPEVYQEIEQLVMAAIKGN